MKNMYEFRLVSAIVKRTFYLYFMDILMEKHGSD